MILSRGNLFNPYDTLKVQLIYHTAASEHLEVQQLISGEELGDRKPTQLLRCMQQIFDDKLVRIFLHYLPHNVRKVLASLDATMDL